MGSERLVRGFFLGLLVLMASLAQGKAHEYKSEAHQVVREVTERMVDTIKAHQDEIDTAPQEYYDAVGQVLEPVVDFSFIARAVMGGYANKATPGQRERFTEVFKTSLVNTYAKGMADYADQDIQVLAPEQDISGQRRVSVEQLVRSGSDVNRVIYTMARNREGQWKLINVVLNGVNLGKTFRSQFYQAMQKNGEDIDQVISGWSSEA